MTVKELIEVLSGCNEDAIVRIEDESGMDDIREEQIFQTPDGKTVYFTIAILEP